ncbi:hypothetical protein Q5752_000565 [Cryptotrichosporon argae]
MPKVFSRAVVSSSDHAKPVASARAVLRSYYCLCGDFVLVLQGRLERLPVRRRDGARIIRSRPGADPDKQPARKFKLNADMGERVLIRRKDTDRLEPRQPFTCSRCHLTVAYQTAAGPAGEAPFLYIVRGALTEIQGLVPDDAFEGEDDVADDAEEARDPADVRDAAGSSTGA